VRKDRSERRDNEYELGESERGERMNMSHERQRERREQKGEIMDMSQ
jgi:hypothetical protein